MEGQKTMATTNTISIKEVVVLRRISRKANMAGLHHKEATMGNRGILTSSILRSSILRSRVGSMGKLRDMVLHREAIDDTQADLWLLHEL